MENFLAAFAAFGIFIFLIIIGIYVAQAIFLNKFNKLVHGKGTALAWIPICNIYLLGKLTINKIVGWVLVVCILITGTYTTTINGVETTYTILPEGISSFVSTLYSIAVLVLFFYAIVKYFKIKKDGNNPSIQYSSQPTNQYQQPIQQQPTQQVNQTQNNQNNVM